ncbi:MAG TPA: response regulator transcription factor [Mycobacteriales bacterium]|nr:response regulator transcription factor [Mycobacteriales bacterium]
MSTQVLVAEDDPKQAELVRRYLEREGYAVTVVHDGAAAIAAARLDRPDLLVLDVMMPNVDGLEVCRELGGEDGIPIVMLTARSTENDLLLGLYLGADDYLTKPFSPRELVARVRAVLRRSLARRPASGQVITVGALQVDPERHEVRRRGAPIECTPAEFDLLLAFVTSPGRVFTRRQLLERVHGGTDYFSERSIDVHVMNLRRKLETDPRKPEHLVTVYGVGYKLVEADADAPSP